MPFIGVDDDGGPVADLPFIHDLTAYQVAVLATAVRTQILEGDNSELVQSELHDLMVKVAEAESFYRFKPGDRVTVHPDQLSDGAQGEISSATMHVSGRGESVSCNLVNWEEPDDPSEITPDKDRTVNLILVEH